MRVASARASLSCAWYCSSAAWAWAWASSALCMPPSMAAVRSAYAFSRLGTTFFCTMTYRMAIAMSPKISSPEWGRIGSLSASPLAACTTVDALANSCTGFS